MSTLTKNRQPVKPVSGVCRWVVPIGDADTGVLSINGTEYIVTVLRDGSRVAGYRMLKSDGTAYDVDAQTWACSCPDATWRQRECKHAKALKAALAK